MEVSYNVQVRARVGTTNHHAMDALGDAVQLFFERVFGVKILQQTRSMNASIEW